MPATRERWRFRLPHWEVADRPHFVTIRCAGSIPAAASSRIRDLHLALQDIEAHSPQFAALQRQYFLSCERYLDSGYGFRPFADPRVAQLTVDSLAQLPTKHGWSAPHFTLMPNHVHLLLTPETSPRPLKEAIRGWKWHIAREANRLLGRTGSFWQPDWFDRWARHESEFVRMRDYIRQNPVKAGLVKNWQDYPWTRCAPA